MQSRRINGIDNQGVDGIVNIMNTASPEYTIGEPCQRSYGPQHGDSARLTTIHAKTAMYGGIVVYKPYIHAYKWSTDPRWQVADLAASRYYGPFTQDEAVAKMRELLDAEAA